MPTYSANEIRTLYNDLGLDVASSLLNNTEVNHGLKFVYIARDPRALVNSRWAKI